MTDTTNNGLAEALAKFQSDLPAVTLDGDNPHFKSKFATLANMTGIVLPKLAENGLAFSTGSFVENGVMILDAHLIHTSGQSRSMQFPITETNPQRIGSAVTYFRRYALASLTGVVADGDDDGNTASIPSVAERQLDKARSSTPSKRPEAKAGTPKDVIRVDWIDKGKITKEEVNERFKAIQASGTKGDAAFAVLLKELEGGK